MYPYFYPVMGVVPPCYYCTTPNRPMIRGVEDYEDYRSETGGAMPPMSEQMPGMGQQMPGMMDMSGMDMGKINVEAQQIVTMLEQHHPDIAQTLVQCGMNMGEARQYLTRVVSMSLMHHMMHQM